MKFVGHVRLQKLNHVLDKNAPVPTSTNAAEVTKYKEDNANLYAELIQLIDDRSLCLVMREANNDGKKALEILDEHYVGKSKPRIISLYTTLTTLSLKDESVTDYLIRAESASAALKTAGETVSDALLIAMVLKGLPPEYGTFCEVINQKDTQTFADFKTAIRSFESLQMFVYLFVK